MINYEQLEDATLFGISESLNYDLANNESGHLEIAGRIISEYQDDELAEQIYSQILGWA